MPGAWHAYGRYRDGRHAPAARVPAYPCRRRYDALLPVRRAYNAMNYRGAFAARKARARKEGRARYNGRPCRHGHGTLRYVRDHQCVECRRITCEDWRARNIEKKRERTRRAAHKMRGYPTPTRPRSERCECCNRPPGSRALHLDHCHVTNTFRGWLCGNCNSGIGKLGDDEQGLRRAIKYLRKARLSPTKT